MVRNGDEIMHYGVKGMKWGIRRTPAQLGHVVVSGAKKVKSAVTKAASNRKAKKQAKEDQKKQEDLNAKKQRVLKSRSAKLLYQNADLFNDQELQAAYNRLNLERNIANLAASQKSSGQKFIDTAITSTRKLGDLMQNTNKIANQGRAFTKFLSTEQKDTSKPSNTPKNSNQQKDTSKPNNTPKNSNQQKKTSKSDDPKTWSGKHFSWNSTTSDLGSEAASVFREAGRDFAKDFQDAPQALDRAIVRAGQDYVEDRYRRK